MERRYRRLVGVQDLRQRQHVEAWPPGGLVAIVWVPNRKALQDAVGFVIAFMINWWFGW